MAPSVSFFDMSASVTPPNGHAEPVPIPLGPNWQPNDYRIMFITGSGAESDISIEIPIHPDPPTAYTTAYVLAAGFEMQGVYYNLLASGDTDTSIAFAKPNTWRHYMLSLLTARGVNPTGTPTAGTMTFNISYTVGSTAATISSLAVPGSGVMIYFLGTTADPENGAWPSSASSLGCPTGWTNLVATDKSGNTYYQFDGNSAVLVVAKVYTGAGSTGVVSVPCQQGSPAFAGMWMFLPSAPDVSITLGAV